MSANNELEIKGLIQRHPVPELIVEIGQTRLTGALRLSSHDKKIILYFELGELVFAASNSREHRLFEVLLTNGRIQKQDLSVTKEFTNDFQLAYSLAKSKKFTEEESDENFGLQIKTIVRSSLDLTEGHWEFSPLARVKEDLRRDVEIRDELYEWGRKLGGSAVMSRFKSFSEEFKLRDNSKRGEPPVALSREDVYVLSRIAEYPQKIEEIAETSGTPNEELMPILFSLWLGGFLVREHWNIAFLPAMLDKIRGTKVTLKQSARSLEDENKEREEAERKARETERKRKAAEERNAADRDAKRKKESSVKGGKYSDKEISIDEFLDLVANAPTYYHMLGVSPKEDVTVIKRSYFSFARRFHPDVLRKHVEPSQLKLVQQAFTEVAHAYETLKDKETREVYDFKLKTVLDAMDEDGFDDLGKLSKEEIDAKNKARYAQKAFEAGEDALLNGEYEEAAAYFGRAIQYEPEEAKHHAFLGKALSHEKKDRHKAEKAIKTAIEMEPGNSGFRLMLAELYVEIGLSVRARNELTKLLESDPGNREASDLLSSL